MGFDASLIGPQFRYADGTKGGGIGTVVQICQANPYRVQLLIQVLVNQATFRPQTAPGTNLGINLASGGLPFILTMAQSGPLVQLDWYASSTVGFQSYVHEVLQQPTPGGE